MTAAEFAAAGKDGVLIRHLLSHTAGLPDWDPAITTEDLYDWPAATGRLVAQAPAWEPGTLSGYHSMTQGFLVGEVVRRITGRSLAAFFADEVAGPLDADFRLVLPPDLDHRFAPNIAPPSSPDGDFVAAPPSRGQPSREIPGSEIRLSKVNSEPFRRAKIPSGSGFGNARSVAVVQSVLACGEARAGSGCCRRQAASRPVRCSITGSTRSWA